MHKSIISILYLLLFLFSPFLIAQIVKTVANIMIKKKEQRRLIRLLTLPFLILFFIFLVFQANIQQNSFQAVIGVIAILLYGYYLFTLTRRKSEKLIKYGYLYPYLLLIILTFVGVIINII